MIGMFWNIYLHCRLCEQLAVIGIFANIILEVCISCDLHDTISSVNTIRGRMFHLTIIAGRKTIHIPDINILVPSGGC